ncbi:MAG: hypothetical protein BGO98_23295 [Myxococcales bacterium 68-20]|nr:hypothetical protein [Myxococcales bacterium]OJY15611.1 MAG: hypothetical protein BGO98_23295 [Myxococcales bacterium 68-20]
MKIPQRILGLLAVAAPVVAGCGAEATEPASTRTDQNIQSESHAATPVSSEPAEDSKASPRPDDATSPDGASPSPSSSSSSSSSSEDEEASPPSEPQHLPPEWNPLEGPPVAPGVSSPSSGTEPCLACGMG